jgi:hypothetical protein
MWSFFNRVIPCTLEASPNRRLLMVALHSQSYNYRRFANIGGKFFGTTCFVCLTNWILFGIVVVASQLWFFEESITPSMISKNTFTWCNSKCSRARLFSTSAILIAASCFQ